MTYLHIYVAILFICVITCESNVIKSETEETLDSNENKNEKSEKIIIPRGKHVTELEDIYFCFPLYAEGNYTVCRVIEEYFIDETQIDCLKENLHVRFIMVDPLDNKLYHQNQLIKKNIDMIID